MTEQKPTSFCSALGYLFSRLNRRHAFTLIIALFAMFAVGVLANQPAVIVGHILDHVLNGSVADFYDILPALILISAALLGKEVLTILRKYLIERMATALEKEEFTRLIGHLLSVNIQTLGQNKIGGMTIRIHRSIEGIIRLLKLSFLEFVPTLATAVVALVMVVDRHWSLSVIMLVVIGTGTILTIAQIASQKGIRLHLFKVKENMGGHLTELLGGIDYVRAAGMRKKETAHAEDLAEELHTQEFRHHKWMMGFDAAKQITESAGFVAVITVGTLLALKGTITAGDVLTLTVLYRAVTMPLQNLHRIIDEGHEAVLKVGELKTMHELARDSGLSGTAPLIKSSQAPFIEAKDLCIDYYLDDQTRHQALKNLNLTIVQGERIGIAGLSGSGKSTFIKCLLGLIPDYQGALIVQGTEMHELDKQDLAKIISYAPQRPFLLAGNVKDNLLYGDDMCHRDDQLWQALASTKMDDRIKSLPQQLAGSIREQGRNLSGGEQQRLMLARTLLKSSELLIFDEASSALDAETDRFVQQTIAKKTKGRTVLTIAHRLGTLRWTDRILVFKDGKIIQNGTYDALAAQDGEFKNLLHHQDAEVKL